MGTNGNDLIGMAGATCDERLVRVLLDAGADPTRGNAHGWTPLHQAAYSNLPLLARMLLDEGPRSTCPRAATAVRRWSSRSSGAIARSPRCWPSAACTRATCAPPPGWALDLVEELVAPDGRLAPDAGAHRAYYRPHSGFPDWRPSDDPQEVLDEALAWAARSDRVDVLEPLVARGARPDADVYRGSALCGPRPAGGPAPCAGSSSSAPTPAVARRSVARPTAKA